MFKNDFNFFKGCVIFAAFFIVTACQDNNSPSGQADTEKRIPIQTVESKPVQKQILKLTKEKSTTTEENTENLTPIADAFLTLNPNSRLKETSFNCDDQIYLSIKFANQEAKLNQIEVSWKDPNDQEREKNNFPFFVSEKETFAWASLKLHRSVGAGMLQWVNPAAGMEEFIGEWTVDVKVGSILKDKINFEVLC